MRIFTRYILKEVFFHGMLGASVFTFVIFMRVVTRILEVVVRNSAPIPSVAEFFFLTLPSAFTVTIPMGVLVGILIGLSRMAADSEVTAMRAAGVGVFRFVRIIAILAVLAWGLALVNNVWIAPRSTAALARLQNSLAASQATFEVPARVFSEDFKNSVLYVQDSTTTSGAAIWKDVFYADVSTPGTAKITTAEEAVGGSAKDAIHLHLINGETHEVNVHEPEQYNIYTFKESDVTLNLPPTPKQAQEIVPVQQMTSGDLLRQARGPNTAAARAAWIEFNRRLALATACLVLVLIGIPLGLSSRKGGKGAGFVLTIALVFIYYFIFLIGVSLASGGRLPVVPGVWLANIIFALVGVVLLLRVDKMRIELGLGQVILSRIKGWTYARTRARDEDRASSQSRTRFAKRFPLLLDDYVLKSFLGYLALITCSFMVLVLVFTFFELLKDIIRNRIPLVTVGEYLMNEIPDMLYLISPLIVLLAVLVTLGLMQKFNEITAMKATGISIYRTTIPLLVIAVLIAGGLFLLDQSYLPAANKRKETLRNTIKGKPAQTYLHADRKWIFGQKNNIYYYEFYDPDRDQFGSISAFEFDPHTFQITKRVYATRARWSESLQQWVFEKGWVRSFRGAAIESYRPFGADVFAELNEPPTYFKKEVRQSSEMSYDELSAYINDLQQSGFDVVRLRVQLQKKIAYPLITVVMALIAVPFALSAGRSGALTGITVAVGIGVSYFVTVALFEALGNASQLPPAIAAWSPDVIFCLAAGYLVLKTPS